MSSVDSALNSSSTLLVIDFIKPVKKDLTEKDIVKYGRISTLVFMVIAAAWAPQIQNFTGLWDYLQQMFSIIVPPIAVIFLVGVFFKRGNGDGAFWTLVIGTLAGIGLFVLEQFDMWHLHYTINVGLMIVLSTVIFVGISLMTPAPDAEKIKLLTYRRELLMEGFEDVPCEGKTTRINKYLSEVGYCSRRAADKLIEQGRVTINGKVPEMGTKIVAGDEVRVDGEPVSGSNEKPVYLAFNKPIGIVCTTDTRVEPDNIVDFINYPKRIFPIGRLDKPSEGLILLTNDGDIVNKILRARNHHEKEYIVTVDKPITNSFIEQMQNGVPILDQVTRKCVVEEITKYQFKIILTQGLNRQIRRMCEYLEYRVKKLKRIRIMNVKLDMPVGRLGFRENRWLQWFVGSYFGFAFTFALYIFLVRFEIMDPSFDYLIDIAIVFFIGMLSFFGFIQPEVFEGKSLKEILPFIKYKKTGLSPALSIEMKGKLLDIMQKDKPYLNHELRLDDISRLMNLSRNHSSWNLEEVNWVSKDTTHILKRNKLGILLITDESYGIIWSPTQDDRIPFKKLSNPTDEEILNGFRSIVFNAGTYIKTDSTMTSTSTIAKVPGFEGASREGKVVHIEESGNDFNHPNNLVVVQHGDNTYAQYMHLTRDGARVKIGEQVTKGQAIGLSGATGLAGYPHLHFVVTSGSWKYPYSSIPKNFSNTTANENSLQMGPFYKGEVIDVANKKPLVFATLTISDTNISTITNTEGQFALKVPADIIEEVNLSVPKNAKILVQQTLQKKGENYFDDPTLMTAFYRETIKKRKKNVSLSEAVVNIYKTSYTSDRKDAVELYKARKSTDYSKLDTVALKLQGGPFNALFVDLIKYPEYIFDEESIDDYKFIFERSTRVNNKLIYIIGFKQLDGITDQLYQGKLYIDAENKILTSAIYSLNITDKEAASKLFVRRKPKNATVWPTEVAYRVDYREKNGRWYYGYSNVLLEFKVNWDKKLFNSVYSMACEMAITDWKKNTNSKLPKYKDRMKASIILNDEALGFADPDFWGEYNIIEPEKSIESAIKKIKRQLRRAKSNGGTSTP
ncbi:23S rRNA pseudouridine(2604) synthase [Nymphon striatum]|nr:23S rRNA pseudouridine(2604) synthase [Nymphon striatum]